MGQRIVVYKGFQRADIYQYQGALGLIRQPLQSLIEESVIIPIRNEKSCALAVYTSPYQRVRELRRRTVLYAR